MRTEPLSTVIRFRAAPPRQVMQLPGLSIQPLEKMDPVPDSLIPSQKFRFANGEPSIQLRDQKHFLTNPGRNLQGLSPVGTGRTKAQLSGLRFPVSGIPSPARRAVALGRSLVTRH